MKAFLEIPELPALQPVDGLGYHVKTVEVDGEEYCIDVWRMMYNWRVTLSYGHSHGEADEGHIHGWCYYGHGEGRDMQTAFIAAVLAANAWDGIGAPAGFDKQAY